MHCHPEPQIDKREHFVRPGVSRAADLCQAGTLGFGNILSPIQPLLVKHLTHPEKSCPLVNNPAMVYKCSVA
jgi:hypothetical protein